MMEAIIFIVVLVVIVIAIFIFCVLIAGKYAESHKEGVLENFQDPEVIAEIEERFRKAILD